MLAPDPIQTLTITSRAPLMLERAIGFRITARRGELWITQYGDSRDIVLKPGQHFDVELPGCLVMAGDKEVEVAVRRPEPAPPAHSSNPAWRRWLPVPG